MTTKKIPISVIERSAGRVASKAGITTAEAKAALKVAYVALGYEAEPDIETTGEAPLDFTKNEKPDFARTQPYQRP